MSWVEVLDDFEHSLDAATAALDPASDWEAPPPFVPPAVTEPFPPELRPRLDALLARSDQVQGEIAATQAAIREELRRLPRAASGAASEAVERHFEAHA